MKRRAIDPKEFVREALDLLSKVDPSAFDNDENRNARIAAYISKRLSVASLRIVRRASVKP